MNIRLKGLEASAFTIVGTITFTSKVKAMTIKKYTCVTVINYLKMASIKQQNLGTDISDACDTIDEQFSKYCTIDPKFRMDMKDRTQTIFDIWFTLYFEKGKLNLLKMKEPDLYNLLEDEITERESG